jgi:hypothetical protein
MCRYYNASRYTCQTLRNQVGSNVVNKNLYKYFARPFISKVSPFASVQLTLLRTAILPRTGATLFLRAPKAHYDRATKEVSTVMHDIDTKNQFLELRAKAWSLSRIAERLKVGQRTLVDVLRERSYVAYTYEMTNLPTGPALRLALTAPLS